ncbi:ankyrin repeat domain-containing protein [Changchengzhania lutea]|uniref:ankyrin repeat domain-containing protein n=1 Tax=Changchengzhania lutea TaxID=2049305 RepID=UPI00115DECE3|nr:ankyrin repeat domain-containing protein [Changchengzhania lutea]
MKTLKINAMQTLLIISFVAFLLTNACAQSDKNSKSDTSTNTGTLIAKPEMNINAAVLSGNLEVVKQHIKAHTDINEKEAMSGSTPLISAASFGKNDIAQALIDAGADLSIKNNDGSTALHAAAFFCRVEIVQMLIDAKADKTIRNNFDATPRETVMVPFDEIKPFYEMLQLQFEPIGMQIDLTEIEKTRPVIAMMLQ